MSDGCVSGRPARPVLPRKTGLAVTALAAALLAGFPGVSRASPKPWPFHDIHPEFTPFWNGDARPTPRRPRTAHPAAAAIRQPKARNAARKPKGPLIIAVSLQRQSLKVYDADGLFAEAPVSTGKRSHATPAGVFSVIQKNKWHRSNIYSGAPMPYMQRLTWSGIALHAGALPGYPASHGCIRMPNAFAAQLWRWTRRGARVVVSHDEIAPVAIVHPLLDALPAAVPVAAAPEPPNAESLGLRPTLSRLPPPGPRTADAADAIPRHDNVISDAPPSVPVSAVPDAPAEAVAAPPKRIGPISLFISRADGRLYARQDFAPLFDVPMTIADADRSLGTHVFTARRDPADKMRFVWSVVTLPEQPPHATQAAGRHEHVAPAALPARDAASALDRLKLPQDVMARIAEGLASGSSLIVADHSLKSGETGQGTEFVVLAR